MTNERQAEQPKHTPGPWYVDPRWLQGRLVIHSGIAPAATQIAVISGDGSFDSADREKANARLMAAAPELLAALQAILGEDPHSPHSIPRTLAEGEALRLQARTAIAKAVQP